MLKQIEQKYTTSLFEKRLQVYPVLYKLLNEANCTIEYNSQNLGSMDRKVLADLRQEYDSWISAYAFLLTSSTGELVWGYHSYLIDILEQFSGDRLPEEVWIEVRNFQNTIGKSLRAELGVYEMKAAGALMQAPYVQSQLERLDQSAEKIRRRFGC